MIVRIVLAFAVFILWGVFLNLYYIVYAFLGIFLLGIESPELHQLAYYICLGLSAVTTYGLIKKVWPKDGEPKYAKPERAVAAVSSMPVAEPSPISSALQSAASSEPPVASQGAAPVIEVCSSCGARVFRKADGTCPSCRKPMTVI